MFVIATRAAHVGACLVLMPFFAFETLIATPAFHRGNALLRRAHGNATVRLSQQRF